MCGALMMLTGEWTKPGVYTVEEFNPDPFLDALDKYGLPAAKTITPCWWIDEPAGYAAAFLRHSAEPSRRNWKNCLPPATCWMKTP